MSQPARIRFPTFFERACQKFAVRPWPMAGAIVCFITFTIWTILVSQWTFLPAEAVFMQVIALTHSAELDLLTGIVNYVAAAEVTLAAMMILSIVLWWRGFPFWRAVAPLLFLFTIPIEFALKFGVNQPSPAETFYRETFRYSLASFQGVLHSFPSGHATRSMFMAILFWYLVRNQTSTFKVTAVRTILLALVALSAFTKTYQGHHWPSDMIGGFLLGAIFAFLTISILDPRPDLPMDRKRQIPDSPIGEPG